MRSTYLLLAALSAVFTADLACDADGHRHQYAAKRRGGCGDPLLSDADASVSTSTSSTPRRPWPGQRRRPPRPGRRRCAATNAPPELAATLPSSIQLEVRGGGILTRKGRSGGAGPADADSAGKGGTAQVLPTILAAVSLSLLASLVYLEHGETVAEFVTSVFDVERFKSWLLRTLNDIDERGGTRGVVLYAVFLALWECVGLSTLALETSAGMAFGMRKGLPVNVAGKIGGACLAYGLGRVFLEEAVRTRLGRGHEVLDLVERSVERGPFRTAIMMRASVFPTLIKNFGLAVMPPVTPLVFIASTALYLIPFSVLWTAAGADSAVRLRADGAGEIIPANRVLGGCLLFATIFMIIGSPAVLALWIRDMRRDQLEMRNNTGRGNTSRNA